MPGEAEDVNLQNIGLAIMSYFIWISELDPTSKQQNHYRENMLVLLVGNLKESYGEQSCNQTPSTKQNVTYPKYHLEKTLSGLEFRLTKTHRNESKHKKEKAVGYHRGCFFEDQCLSNDRFGLFIDRSVVEWKAWSFEYW